LRVGFAVDEHEIGMDVTVAKILPLTGERVIAIFTRQGHVGEQQRKLLAKLMLEGLAVAPLFSRL
jgi:hypothetical protein